MLFLTSMNVVFQDCACTLCIKTGKRSMNVLSLD
jgi:hypothetical protein